MKNIDKTKLADKLKPLYQEMFDTVDEAKDENYIKFCIQWGEEFPVNDHEGIMFYGRANNGWMCYDTTADDVFDPNNPDRAFARDDQMVWVEESASPDSGYNTNSSAFWRVIRSVAKEFYPDNELQKIAWSNLCKIAPAESNPSDTLYYGQLPSAAKVMSAEIDYFSPKHVVLLTGEGWALPFLRQIFGTDELKVVDSAIFGGASSYDIKVYENDGVYYYVSEHPQGKNESTHVEALVKLISERM